jgi:uncharacterized iron-regulated membrane protein
MSIAARPLLFKLHLYISIAFGLYVGILGITGSIMAFQREIDRFAHADLAYVTPAPQRLSLAEIDAAVAKTYPGQASQHMLGETPDLATGVRVGRTLVYVNPYTGEVLGSVTLGSDAVMDTLNFVHNVHEHLAPFRHGPLAGVFLGWTCVAALFLVVSGTWLWWPRMRFSIGGDRGRPFWYDLHVTLGIAAAAMLYTLTGSQPTPQQELPPPPAEGARAISADRALAIAGEALPGAAPTTIYGPTPQGIYVVFARTASDPNPFGRSQVEINQYTGAVLYAEVLDTAPGGSRLMSLTRAVHTGDAFGLPGKALLALASLIVALQALTGMVMWIKRLPFRRMIPALAMAGAVTAVALFAVFAPA